MAAEITLTQNDIDKIHSTEKMTKATLIVVSVTAGLMLLFGLVMMVHGAVDRGEMHRMGPGQMQGGMSQPGFRGRGQSGGIQPQLKQNQQPSQGQTQDSNDSIDINAL